MVTPAALHSAAVPTVQSGLDVLVHHRLGLLRGRRFGLLAHQASVDARLRHAVTLLRDVRGARLAALFAPEHGLWGAAQDHAAIASTRDPATGLRVTSLYGARRIPTPAMLRGLDVLVIDLQDVGSRYYTFQWTMALALQACARAGVRMLVLDRPNPLGGEIVEGNVPDPAFASFVGLYPLPARPGLTLGELARYLNSQHGLGCALDVVTMRGWRRRRLWGGVQIHVTERARFEPFLTGLAVIAVARRLAPRAFRWRPPPYEFEHRRLPIDILLGTDQIRRALTRGTGLRAIERGWQRDLAGWKRRRAAWLQYRSASWRRVW